MPKPNPNLSPQENAARGTPILDTSTGLSELRAKALDYAVQLMASKMTTMTEAEAEVELWATVDRFETHIKAGR